jgi:hypothetical protein
MHTFIYPGDQRVSVDLYGLGYRCLHEPASRRLDGKIYCTVHMIRDRSPLINDRLVHARANGEVLVEHCPGDGLAWIEAPPFTAELEYAESLLPEGLLTFYRDADECVPQRYRCGLSPTGRRRRGFLTSSNCARSASLAEDRRPDHLVGKFADKALP